MSNLLTCPRGQMWAPNLLKSATWRHNSLLKYVGSAQRRPEDLPPPGLRSAGGPKLLKWGLPGEGTGEGSNLLKCGRPLLPPPRPLTSTIPRLTCLRLAQTQLPMWRRRMGSPGVPPSSQPATPLTATSVRQVTQSTICFCQRSIR